MILNKIKNFKSPKRRNLVSITNPDSRISEQYRSIWANLKYIKRNTRSQRLLITSPNEGDGKSTSAANLAVTMAMQKEKVLLIDANLRNPALDYIFKLTNARGLSDVLIGSHSFEEAVHPSRIGRLDILTSGPLLDYPAELIESERMGELLKMADSLYDIVIIDAPAILNITETKLLANKCDGVVIIIKDSKTKREDALTAKKALKRIESNIVGLIMNG
ncbi:CpsD/CapB family tyrosine-protein kinase [Peribacillus sp. SCS-37]|uniref:CpsD/CapB family tyrosine-protein kinase n=1 Tax=Paraperibacillus esterisolvens TaxID=3115296 RepID=UPI00390689C4